MIQKKRFERNNDMSKLTKDEDFDRVVQELKKFDETEEAKKQDE